MKRFSLLLFSLLIESTCLAASNIDWGRTILFYGGDSRAANEGQSAWYPTLTNMCKDAGHTVHAIYKAAHNGDYIASSGGLMDEWTNDVQPFIDAAYYNLYIMDVGANHNEFEDVGGTSNSIAASMTFLIRGTNQGVHFAWLTLEENWRSTNVTFGATYEINRAIWNNFVLTNKLIEYPINNNPPYIDLPAYDWSLHADNPPLHRNALGSADTATNIFQASSTNETTSLNVGTLKVGTAHWGL